MKAAKEGSSECISCGLGAKSDTGSAKCTPCDAGEAGTGPNGTCAKCSVGKKRATIDINTTFCIRCSEGRYQPESGEASCLPVQPGHYTNEKGQHYSKSCNALKGEYQDESTSSSCKTVEAGFTVSSGSTAKVQCGPGRAGMGCKACPIGHYRPGEEGEDRTTCLQCPKGYVQDIEGQTACNVCQLGKHQSNKGKDLCVDCEDGTFRGINSDDPSVCSTCQDDGQVPNLEKTSCEKPKWKIKSDCDNDFYLNDTDTLNKYMWKCVSCPNGASCKGNINASKISAFFGWSKCDTAHLNNERKFSRCSFPGACLGRTNLALKDKYPILAKCDDVNNLNCSEHCNTGYLDGSRLCGQCDNNFSHVGLTGKCDQCPPPGQNIVIGIVAVVAGLFGLVVFIQITLSDGGTLDESDGAKSIGLSFIQLISLLVTFPIAWPPIFIAIFQVGGAITVLGQHLVNLKW